ncbi:hypothetical protein FRAAL2238 [Frankia alni ACN14a]|uniref:Uncharacterized protein n=1 Tax=Frankia alni (strain DSM 45986 / CECT 9034 / ACN14a) TaxID=326424 RepID=Q0RNK1_FRAAA|nr:hypothetical protein FRAAL2238 [Frankia alni ACN14a]
MPARGTGARDDGSMPAFPAAVADLDQPLILPRHKHGAPVRSAADGLPSPPSPPPDHPRG